MKGLEHQKLVRTLRLSLTCIFLFLITWYYQVPESAWALITIWFVMYEYSTVGGVYTKGFLRFSGTTLSAIYGMIIVYFCDNNPLINVLALVPGLLIYAYYFMGGEKTYIGTIGAVTLTIVLLNYNDIDTAIVRVFNVILGIIASMVMIRWFYPQYARDKLIALLIMFLRQSATLIEKYLDNQIALFSLQSEFLTYEEKMVSGFNLYTRYLNESKIETKRAPFFTPSAFAAFQHFKRVFRLLTVLFSLLTDQLRNDPWVRLELNKLVLALKASACKLLNENDEEITQHISADTLKKKPRNSKLENRIATQSLLEHMHKELNLLQIEIEKIIVIYDFYDVQLDRAVVN